MMINYSTYCVLDDEGEDQPSIQPLSQQNMDSKFDSGDFNQDQLKFL